MTFKIEWEKAHTKHSLADPLIEQMLEAAYPHSKITSFGIMGGGCVNLNIKFKRPELDSPEVLRVYLRDPEAAYKEQKIAENLSDDIPAPRVTHIGKASGYTFSISEFKPGQPLSQLLLSDEQHDLNQIMGDVGVLLAKISSVHFEKTGFFNRHLEVATPIARNDALQFATEALDHEHTRSVLSLQQSQKIRHFLNLYGDLFPGTEEKNLVHADFDPANILVHKAGEQWKVSGILDWEFSFSGSSLFDVANMLRYAHHMPKSYEESFLAGLTSGGYTLPQNWRVTVSMLNLFSLLDCLQRYDPLTRPRRLSDIQHLIDHILSTLDKEEY